MSRRGAEDEIGFGSDSFLDVIANLVGILIILIVVAGIQVSRSPVLLKLDTPAAVPVDPEPLPPEPVPESPPELPVDLIHQAGELEAELAHINTVLQEDVSRLKLLNDERRALADSISAKEQQISLLNSTLEAESRQIGELRDEVERGRVQLAELEEELRRLVQSPLKTKRLEHRLTPISRTVKGKELHYRLLGNRVAVVPLQPLVERLKDQLERKKDWIAKFREHRGQVGPVDGFSMRYLVERESMSVLDEMRFGATGYRITVTQWQLEPEPDLLTESGEEALRPGSRFYQSLVTAPAEVTLTFWVYPDSFGLYRKLQTFAHEQGFTVAGRPLPHGMPIAGSPHGSRSAAQ